MGILGTAGSALKTAGGALKTVGGTYMAATKALDAVNKVGIIKDTMTNAANAGNKYDRRLGTNVLQGKNNTWGPRKYASEDEPTFSKDKDFRVKSQITKNFNKKKDAKSKKRQKQIAIGVGATVGALCLASALATGNALAPFEIMANSIKKAPGLLFDKAKNNQYGGTIRTVANGLDKAVRQTKIPQTGSLYNARVHSNNSFGINAGKGSDATANSDVTKIVNNVLSGIATGLATGVGTYGAQMLAKNISKDSGQNQKNNI